MGPPDSPPWAATLTYVDQAQADDCWIACLATLTGLPLADFPQPPAVRSRDTEHAYRHAVTTFLGAQGWILVTWPRTAPRGWAIGSGVSPRDPFLWHCVVVLDGRPVHDPHPSRAGVVDGHFEEFEMLIPAVREVVSA